MEEDLKYLEKHCKVIGKTRCTEAIDHLVQAYKDQQAELENKDNVIDEMVNLIYEIATGTPGTTFHYLKKYGFDDNECSEEKCKSKNCKICIKQHFERKLNSNE